MTIVLFLLRYYRHIGALYSQLLHKKFHWIRLHQSSATKYGSIVTHRFLGQKEKHRTGCR